MRIASVQHTVPRTLVTNDDVHALVRETLQTKGMDDHELGTIAEQIDGFLAIAGTRERYICDGDEKPIDLVLDAGRRALKDAQMEAEDLDFLIYTGVGRGFLEPATANVIQGELEAVRANSFDVLDACASWIKALHLGHSLVRSGAYRTGMIVNCEAGFRNLIDLDITSAADLESRFAAFTIGEAATATIVDAETPDDDFHFRFQNFGEHFQLCMIPLENAAGFMPEAPDERLTSGRFFSLSRDLISVTVRKIIQSFGEDTVLKSREHDITFGHQASDKAADLVRERLGIPAERYFSTHSRFGNTVSASVPLSMSLAAKEDRLHRGDRVLVVVGSAGISVGFASFTY